MVEFTISPQTAGQRADVFIASQFPQYTRSALSRLFENHIHINGKSVKTGYALKLGDVVSVNTSLLDQNVETIELPILYENEDVIVIDKPAGILTHAKGGMSHEGTVASFIADKISFEPMTNKSGIVHRLDRATSGVIICAKHAPAQKWLQRQFATRKVQKTYYAVVSGLPHPAKARIDAPIGRNPRKPQTFIATEQGRSAQTDYEVIRHTDSKSLLRLQPLTGRTHQIRVHLQYIGHPIVGDYLYGGKEAERLYLHAAELRLQLPNKQERVFTSQLPKEFTL